jgi:hypothetical protein
LGSSALSGTTTPSITISPVTEARSESLPPILGAESPFMPFSRIKPRIWLLCSADFAHTTNTSAIGALEIHILLPVRR